MRQQFLAILHLLEGYTKTDLRYLTRNGAWVLLGQIGSIILGFATSVAFGHLAGQDTYGNYRYVLSLAGLFGAFSLTGIGTAITQATARGFEGSLHQGFRLSMKWSGGMAAISFAAAGYYWLFQHNSFLAGSLIVVGLISPLINSFSLFDPFLIGKKMFARETLYSFLNSLFPVVAVIISLFVTNRAIVVICVYFAANALSDILFFAITKRITENSIQDPGLLHFGGHLSAMGILNALADKVDSIVVFSLLGPASMGIYSFAIAMPEQLKAVIKSITPLSIARFGARSLTEIDKTIWHRIGILAVAVTAAVLAYIAIAKPLFEIFFPRYVEAIQYSELYATTLIVTVFTTPLLTVFQAHKRTRDMYIVSIVGSAVLLTTTPLLGFFYGIAGVMLSIFVYRTVSSIAYVILFKRAVREERLMPKSF